MIPQLDGTFNISDSSNTDSQKWQMLIGTQLTQNI